VLRQDKELIVLPVLSIITAGLLVLPFFIGAIAIGATSDSDSLGPVGWVLMFIGYLVGAYVTIFFQTALVLGANDRMTGGSPTLGSALSMAGSNAGRILPWAIISATVSVALQAIQERSGAIGRIVIGLVGLAWTLVTMLVLPILVIEQVGVKDALSRSATAFKRTWGENVVGNGGIGIVGLLGTLIGLVVAGPIVAVGVSRSNTGLVILGVALFVLWILLVSAFTSALSAVFRTALYRFAVLGEEPTGFTHEQIADAFRPRSKAAPTA
jgi:hypothetical protein